VNFDWIAPLAVGLLGFIGGNGINNLRSAARHRAEISSNLEILERLPHSDTRTKLSRHIEDQVGTLLFFESEYPGYRAGVRRSALRLTLALIVVILIVLSAGIANSPDEVRLLFLSSGLLVIVIGGLELVFGIGRRRSIKRILEQSGKDS
jgi:hypothetical protein